MIGFGPTPSPMMHVHLLMFMLSFFVAANASVAPTDSLTPSLPPSAVQPGAGPRLLATPENDTPLLQEGTRFIRYSKGRKIQRLETALVQYRSEEANLEITLVAAVHIGDSAYYRDLGKKLESYPFVLFEGLKQGEDLPEDSLLTLLDRLQNQFKVYLSLEHQSDHLSTKKKNFVAADLKASEVQKRLKEAKIDLVPAADLFQSVGPFMGRILKALAPQKDAKPSAFLNKIRDRAKRYLAQILGDGNAYYQRFKRQEEKKRDAIIIEARNEHALNILDNIRSQHDPRKVAILYGAGHMADFESRLKKRFPDLSLRKVEWLAAWTIGVVPAKKPTPKPSKKPTEGKKI